MNKLAELVASIKSYPSTQVITGQLSTEEYTIQLANRIYDYLFCDWRVREQDVMPLIEIAKLTRNITGEIN